MPCAGRVVAALAAAAAQPRDCTKVRRFISYFVSCGRVSRTDDFGADGGLQYDLDAVSDILLRSDLERRFFGEFDQTAEVGGEFVEDQEARGGMECIAAMQGVEGDL